MTEKEMLKEMQDTKERAEQDCAMAWREAQLARKTALKSLGAELKRNLTEVSAQDFDPDAEHLSIGERILLRRLLSIKETLERHGAI